MATGMVEMARKSPLSVSKRRVDAFLRDEQGATAIEYALIASGIAAAIISIVFGVGTTITNTLYDRVNAGLR
jgi:pilus assembly protein Flp/PilA